MDINNEILYRLSKYLNDYATSISKEQIESITSIGVSENEAYKLLLASYLNIEDRNIIITNIVVDENTKEIHLEKTLQVEYCLF